MKLLVGMCAYNEMHRIKPVVKRLLDKQKEYDCGIVFGNDGSTDGTGEYLKELADVYSFGYIGHKKNTGVGSMIRDIIIYGMDHGYDVITFVSANGKTNMDELPRMFEPVMLGEYDYVKGSRYLKGGSKKNIPLFRLISIPIFSAFVSLLMLRRITDVTALINASRIDIYRDNEIDIRQSWLDTYEFEYYILFYVLKKRYRFKEVPMSIDYPEDNANYSKIKPFSGWWKMIKPWLVLRFGIKK